MKKILIIAYNYPPINNGGVQRIINFKKYLSKNGFDVYVLTSASHGEEVGDDHTFRYKDKGYEIRTSKDGLKSKLFKYVRALGVYLGILGDVNYLWKNQVIKDVDRVICEVKPDYILASYPPVADLQIGEYVHDKYNIPLIVDYRDGLMYEPFEYIKKQSVLYEHRLLKMEKRLAEKCCLQIVVNEQMFKYYNQFKEKKTINIPNGFDDEEIIEGEEKILTRDKKNVVYTGGLGNERYSYSYSYSILEFMFQHMRDINFVFVGNYGEYEKRFFGRFKNVYVFNSVSRSEAVLIQRKADALLLISGDSPAGTSGKLFEYLFAGKPILHIGSRNNAADIIEETNTGVTFNKNQKYEILSWLEDLVNERIHINPCNLEQYTRRYECKKLAEAINDLTVSND